VVPWFGGVYTRLDMTFIENWDFSLQYNNDSYFDSTGFARLTYRMGGSRRRNVPDQMEQPMMRNEHIVRAHQTPVAAKNPETGEAWRVIHVDNSSTDTGAGTAESPYSSLASAQAAAVKRYDIVYVHQGASATSPYVTPISGYSFGAADQYFIGEGSSLTIPTSNCGATAFFGGNGNGAYPILTNPLGPAIAVNQPGSVVSHFQVVGARVGISDGTGFATGLASVSDVIIAGSGPGQRGVEIANSTAAFTFDKVRLSNLTDDGFVISANGGDVSITNSSIVGTRNAGVKATGANAVVSVASSTITETSGTAVESAGTGSTISLHKASITNTAGDAIVASGATATAIVNSSTIRATSSSALVASGASSIVSATSTVIASTGNPAIELSGVDSQVILDRTNVNNVTGVGVALTGAASRFTMANSSRLTNVSGDGIYLANETSFASISGRSVIRDVGGDGINSVGASVHFVDSTIQTVGGSGIEATGVSGNRVVWMQGGTITNAQDTGITVLNSNLRVERLDPANPRSSAPTISNAGTYGIEVTADSALPNPPLYRVLVDSARISGVDVGISVASDADQLNPPPAIPSPPVDIPTIDFTAQNNQITTSGSGAGIAISAYYDASVGYPGRPLSRVNARMTGNTLSAVGNQGTILLTTAGDTTIWTTGTGGTSIDTPAAFKPVTVAAGSSADLGNLNNGAAVDVEPVPSSTVFNRALSPLLPPPPPTPP
jgi:hypothetical protein